MKNEMLTNGFKYLVLAFAMVGYTLCIITEAAA
jgi:hypothetical protein